MSYNWPPNCIREENWRGPSPYDFTFTLSATTISLLIYSIYSAFCLSPTLHRHESPVTQSLHFGCAEVQTQQCTILLGSVLPSVPLTSPHTPHTSGVVRSQPTLLSEPRGAGGLSIFNSWAISGLCVLECAGPDWGGSLSLAPASSDWSQPRDSSVSYILGRHHPRAGETV